MRSCGSLRDFQIRVVEIRSSAELVVLPRKNVVLCHLMHCPIMTGVQSSDLWVRSLELGLCL